MTHTPEPFAVTLTTHKIREQIGICGECGGKVTRTYPALTLFHDARCDDCGLKPIGPVYQMHKAGAQ